MMKYCPKCRRLTSPGQGDCHQIQNSTLSNLQNRSYIQPFPVCVLLRHNRPERLLMTTLPLRTNVHLAACHLRCLICLQSLGDHQYHIYLQSGMVNPRQIKHLKTKRYLNGQTCMSFHRQYTPRLPRRRRHSLVLPCLVHPLSWLQTD